MSTQFWSLMCSLVMLPIMLGYLLVATEHWRCPLRARVLRLGLGLLCATAIDTVIFVQMAGTAAAKSNIVLLDLAFLLILALLVSPWQQGRTLFISASAGLCFFITSAMTSMLMLPHSLLRLTVNIAINVVSILLVRRYFASSLRGVLSAGRGMWYKLSLVPLAYFIAFGISARLRVVEVGMPQMIGSIGGNIAIFFVFISSYVTFYRLLQNTRQASFLRHDNTFLNVRIASLKQEALADTALRDSTAAFHAEIASALVRIEHALNTHTAAHEALEALSEGIRSVKSANAYTGNPLIDAVLSDYAAGAASAGVTMEIDLRLPVNGRIDTVGLAVVLANGLENALTACCALPQDRERRIHLLGDTRGQQFLLQIENSYSGTVRFDKATGCPRSGHEGHGYGTQSIAAFAQKYGGIIDFIAANGVFKLRILLQLQQEKPTQSGEAEAVAPS